jgi:predicted phosphodiesterase
MIIFLGDVHFKQKQPYYNSVCQLLEYLLKEYPNSILVQTGDFFDTSNPHSELIVDKAIEYLLQFKEVHIISGNHELSNRTGNPLYLLNRIDKLNVYLEPKEVVIQDKNFLMLPYLYNLKQMKELYETYDCTNGTIDYVVSHVAYPDTNFGSPDEINLSHIKANKFIYGHIHKPQVYDNHIIIGVPVSTRYGEHEWVKQIGVLQDNVFELREIPSFINFENLEFNEEPNSNTSILNVYNAPSVKAVIQRYKDNHIRLEGIKLINEESKITYNEQKDFLNYSLEKNFQDFCTTTEIREPVKNKIYEYFLKTN